MLSRRFSLLLFSLACVAAMLAGCSNEPKADSGPRNENAQQQQQRQEKKGD